MKKIEYFCPGERYKYDFDLCGKGYAQLDTGQDASYFGTWAHPIKFVIFCYCEGDCTTTLCDNKEEFIAEVKKCAEWNNEQGWSFAIDPGWHDKDGDPWRDLGLGHYLH